MITAEMRAEMRRLVLVEGWKIQTVANRYGVHHSTVQRALDIAPKPESSHPSGLDPFKPYLVQRLTDYPQLTATRLFEELQERGYTQSIAIVRRYVAKVRAPRSRKAYLRIETEPGEQAQVDWGSFGKMRVGATHRPLSVFVMVMSWSRAVFLDFSLDQRMDSFCRMHQRAFKFFDGIPKRVLYDNLKSVVLHHVGTTVQFNPTFLGFASHYLFEPVAAPVRYPEAKGRAEAIIKYIRHSFFYGRSFSSLSDLRAQAAHWRDNVANARLHATVRERPCDRLLVERPRLRPLPTRGADTDLVLSAIVSKDCRVRLDTNTYSVPPQCVGLPVHVRADDHVVRIVCDGEQVAEHPRCWDRRRAIEDRTHIEKLLERRTAAREPKRRERLENFAPECRIYLREVARRRINLDNEIRKLLRLVAIYGQTEVAGGMAKALAQRTFGANYVRALIDQARFARGLGEPPEPIVTGNAKADAFVVNPHDLETYDALFTQTSEGSESDKATDPSTTTPAAGDVGERPDSDT